MHEKPEIIDGVFYEKQIQKVKKDDDIFFVQNVIKSRKNKKGETEYLIKWLGYPEKFNTWEPAKNIIKDLQNKNIEKESEGRIEFSV